ncbi:MFS transporter [Bradyrhizobium sp. CSA207]|uniref:MFS transporter n=1 Tax=Bradyrhizobium sp. CSA207 TaxID=2698826 RepID=UPI0023B17741|nr:MFS transporter [Bradyrhizobium sp. CSA207]MDE5445808.1 MFS transporter [Bradyrhizobium sp. CSA207]
MLFLFMLINFADKAILGLAAVPIMRDLALDHTTFGLIGTSFFAFFSISAVLIGFVSNRFPTKWILGVMALSWSVVQLPMLLPLGLVALFANRILLGFGEGPAYPVALHAIYKWFPNDQRPLPTSIIFAGVACGAGLFAPLLVHIIVEYSWRTAFGLLGVVGLAWCAVWYFVGKEGQLTDQPAASARTEGSTVPYARLLTCPTFVGQTIAGFASYWLVALSVVWLPAYLTKAVGYKPSEMGWIVAMPSLVQIVMLPLMSRLSEALKRRGLTSRIARGGLAYGGLLASGLLTVLLPYTTGFVLPAVCATLAFSLGGLIPILGPVMLAEITPSQQRGAVLSIGNAAATLAGPLAPVITGMIVDRGVTAGAGFGTGFIWAGAIVSVLSILAFLLINPDRDRVQLASASAQAAGESIPEPSR